MVADVRAHWLNTGEKLGLKGFWMLTFWGDCTGSSLLHSGFPVVASRGCFLVAICGLLTVLASLVVEHGL